MVRAECRERTRSHYAEAMPIDAGRAGARRAGACAKQPGSNHTLLRRTPSPPALRATSSRAEEESTSPNLGEELAHSTLYSSNSR